MYYFGQTVLFEVKNPYTILSIRGCGRAGKMNVVQDGCPCNSTVKMNVVQDGCQ